MKKIAFIFLALLVTIVAFNDSAFSFARSSANKYITIGTGGVTGVYYPAGGAICRLVNRGRKDHGIRCSVESTGGSIDNLVALKETEIDIAVAQSDWQYHAYNGTAFFSKYKPMTGLRSLFSLHSEPLTIIVRKDSKVSNLDDIKGKIVNIGNKGSGMRATFDFVMKHKGWNYSDFKAVSELRASQQASALCQGDIDVMIYAAGHPNGAVQEATTTCDAKIVPINDKDIKELVDKTSYYTFTTIPGGMYNGNEEDITTIGVKATFVAAKDLDSDIVYSVVRAIFDNFDNFKTLHPVFTILKKEDLVFEGNTAPLHEGAMKYFKESGLYQKKEENKPELQ